ncbi:hypothetical protein HDU96_001566, partial [Phlyctochytrium bullatum]
MAASATPNDCKILADAFPALQLQSSDAAPAICCSRNVTGIGDLGDIACRNGRIVYINYSPFRPLYTVIPSTIGSLDALEYLSLSKCGLTGSIPPSLGSLSKLTHL